MMSRTALTNQRCNSRQASVLVCVLVCLAVSMALVTATVRNAVDERRAMRTQYQLRQTELLLAAGIQRATQQLQAATDYTGETWELAAETISGVESAQVEIDITPAANADVEAEKPSRKVRVTARLSTGPHTTIQRSYSFLSISNNSR